MNPEIKQQWLSALRSGEYKQAKGKLRKKKEKLEQYLSPEATYCCMGVLCDILKHRVQGKWENDCFVSCSDRKETVPTLDIDYVAETTINSLSISREMLEQHLSPKDRNSLHPQKEMYYLSDLNDDVGLSFTQIADLIEKYF
jgi:hypothetical protein